MKIFRIILAGLLAAGCIGAVATVAWAYLRVELDADRQRGQTCGLYWALRAYAMANHDKFPDKLEDLVPDYLQDWRPITYPDRPETHQASYYYYGAGHTLKDPGENILLASKWVYAGKRIIVLFDGCAQYYPALSPLPPLPVKP